MFGACVSYKLCQEVVLEIILAESWLNLAANAQVNANQIALEQRFNSLFVRYKNHRNV